MQINHLNNQIAFKAAKLPKGVHIEKAAERILGSDTIQAIMPALKRTAKTHEVTITGHKQSNPKFFNFNIPEYIKDVQCIQIFVKSKGPNAKTKQDAMIMPKMMLFERAKKFLPYSIEEHIKDLTR